MLIPQTGRAVLAPASFGQGRHRRQPAHPCQWRSRHPLPGVRRCRAVGTLLPRRARRRGAAHGGAVDRRSGQQLGRLRLLRRPRLYVPDATNSHIASFSIGARAAQAGGPSPAVARRVGRHRCQLRQIPQHLPQAKQSRAGLAAPRNRLMSRGSAGAHQGASPARAASRPAKSSPQGPQARRCAAMPG